MATPTAWWLAPSAGADRCGAEPSCTSGCWRRRRFPILRLVPPRRICCRLLAVRAGRSGSACALWLARSRRGAAGRDAAGWRSPSPPLDRSSPARRTPGLIYRPAQHAVCRTLRFGVRVDRHRRRRSLLADATGVATHVSGPFPKRLVLTTLVYPQGRKPLSYHPRDEQWEIRGNEAILRSAAKGQEFVIDGAYYPELGAWVASLIRRNA